MAAMSDTDIIKRNPLNNALDAVRHQFKSACERLNVTDSPNAVESALSKDSGAVGTDLVFNLLETLQLHSAAKALPSRTGNGTILRDLSRFIGLLSSNQANIKMAIPLVRRVISDASDIDIWNAVFDLLLPSTPPATGPSSISLFQQTPRFYNSNVVDSTESLALVLPLLRNELQDNLIMDHKDFVLNFLDRVPNLQEMAEIVFKMCSEANPPLFIEGEGWAGWPKDCNELHVLPWLKGCIKKLIGLAQEQEYHPPTRRQCVTAPNEYLDGSVAKRKLDISIVRDIAEDDESVKVKSVPRWSEVLTLGELKSDPQADNHQKTWLDLIKYVRGIFTAQDNRRFVLGFTLCGSIQRLWEFDRLGAVSSEAFDINKNGLAFVKSTLAFLWMDEESLGFDPNIKKDGKERYIEIVRNGRRERLILENLMGRQSCVVGRGSTCWRAYREDDKVKIPLAVKDSWQYEERPEEGILLEEVTKQGAKNIARYYHHETVKMGNCDDSIDIIRNRLRKEGGTQIDLQLPSDNPGFSVSGVTDTNFSRKRPASVNRIDSKPRKRSRSTLEAKEGCQRNRIRRRVVMQDVGKRLNKASSLVGLLTGIIGGIKGHESLVKINILHRDISVGNIMLTEKEDDGFLIDLDLAVHMERKEASGALSITGTKVFMAIGALSAEPHSFRHDLESFFWVLFWTGVHYNGHGHSRTFPIFDQWNALQVEALGHMKRGFVVNEGVFQAQVTTNFSDYCKALIPCILELRKVVFPDGKPWSEDDRGLYSRMITVLEKAREDLKVS